MGLYEVIEYVVFNLNFTTLYNVNNVLYLVCIVFIYNPV